MYKAAKDAGDEKKLEKHRKIALDLTKKKKQLELALDQALGGLYQDAELELKEQAPRMKKDAYVENLRLLYKDMAQMERQMKMADSSRYSHVRRDWDKALLHVAKLTNILNRKGPTIPEGINEAVYDDMLKAVPDNYSYKNLAADVANIIKNEYGSHNIKPFIQELSKMLKEETEAQFMKKMNDPVLVAARAARDKSKAAPDSRKRKMSFDKYFDLMDLESDLADQIKDVGEQINQLLADMEQEAEPGGGPIANRYGAKLDQLENRYIKLKQNKAKITKAIEDYRSS